MEPDNTILYTPRGPLFGKRGPLLNGRARLFKPGYTTRPLTTQDGFNLTTQEGRTLVIQGRPSA